MRKSPAPTVVPNAIGSVATTNPIPGVEIEPSAIAYHDTMDGQWKDKQNPFCDRVRKTFPVTAGEKVIVAVRDDEGNVTQQPVRTVPQSGDENPISEVSYFVFYYKQ